MSLSVDAYYVDVTGDEHRLKLESSLVGFEAARRNFYGAKRNELALELLPQLDGRAMLDVRGVELGVLLIEVEKLLSTLSDNEIGDFWRFRLNNIKAAVLLAQTYGDAGGVCIG